MDGCVSLVHHRDTVASFLPKDSASHRLVFLFSARTTFILLIGIPISAKIDVFCNTYDYILYYSQRYHYFLRSHRKLDNFCLCEI